MRGSGVAKRRFAKDAACDWSTDFRKMLFPEPRPSTRLGDDPVRLDIRPPIVSPFDSTVSIGRLNVPRWMLQTETMGEDAHLRAEDGDLRCSWDSKVLSYDFTGIHERESLL